MRRVTVTDTRFEHLHSGVLSDPEAVWPELRVYLCEALAYESVDLIEDLMFWHSDTFIDRLEALVDECPSVAERVAVAYVGGVAGAGVERFHALQERLSLDQSP